MTGSSILKLDLHRQEKLYLPGHLLSTAIYRFRCSRLPRAVLTSSPGLPYSPPFFTPMTLDSNAIQVSRMNCPGDQDGCGKLFNSESGEGIHRAIMLAALVPNNGVLALDVFLTFHFAFDIFTCL